MSITVNDVRDGLIAALVLLYPGVKVTGEEITQGLGQNHFFVKLLSGGQDKQLGRRYRRMHAFDVHYFGPDNEELHAAAERLYGGLGTIQTPDGRLRGTGMRHEIVNRVLHFFVDYNTDVLLQVDPVPLMQTLKPEANIPNG